jgi:hypothetical protein
MLGRPATSEIISFKSLRSKPDLVCSSSIFICIRTLSYPRIGSL